MSFSFQGKFQNLNLCVPGYLGEFVFRAVFELESEIDQPFGESHNSGCKKPVFVEKEAQDILINADMRW